jgi:hypothetical protein
VCVCVCVCDVYNEEERRVRGGRGPALGSKLGPFGWLVVVVGCWFRGGPCVSGREQDWSIAGEKNNRRRRR